MVSNLQLQLYKHNYGLVCMTGLLGCRWHRYKQSTQPNRKRDIAWYITLLLTSFFVVVLFYFFLVAINDEDDFNWLVYMQTQNKWVPWFTYVLAVISTIFAYIVIILLLSLCHIIQGHQVYIHPVHLFFIIIILATCCVLVWALEEYWQSEWTVVYLSLLIIGPFLQLGAVVIMTLLSWVISHQYYKIKHTGLKILCICTYLTVMIGLYISPLFIKSPCVIEAENIPDKPKIFAQKGAPVVAPENTVISFKIAIDNHAFGIGTDVRISFDGVPFLMHDSSLHRTTNIESVFPGMADKDPSYFNISQLKMLNAGEWFLQVDPRHSVASLSENEKVLYRNQSIPTLSEFLQLAKLHKTVVMFDIKIPPPPHPYHNMTVEQVFKVIEKSGISGSQIWYLAGDRPKLPVEFKYISKEKLDVGKLRAQNMTGMNLQYSQIALKEIDNYSKNNITSNIYTVNSAWLFSLYWCVGVDSVLTDYCHVLNKQESPVWNMPPQNYLLLWISVDVVSFLLVVVIFIIQRIRFMGKRYIPEQVSLNSHSNGNPLTRNYHSRRSMKEKLIVNDIHSDIFDYDDEPDEVMGFESGGYDATINATDGRILAWSFHGNGYTYQTEAQIT